MADLVHAHSARSERGVLKDEWGILYSSALMAQHWLLKVRMRLWRPMSPASSTAQITGVLLMAHGSPDNLDDMGAYLQHVRGGRATPQALVDDIRGRYQLIGGARRAARPHTCPGESPGRATQ